MGAFNTYDPKYHTRKIACNHTAPQDERGGGGGGGGGQNTIFLY
jgi:hypothetical protein